MKRLFMEDTSNSATWRNKTSRIGERLWLLKSCCWNKEWSCRNNKCRPNWHNTYKRRRQQSTGKRSRIGRNQHRHGKLWGKQYSHAPHRTYRWPCRTRGNVGRSPEDKLCNLRTSTQKRGQQYINSILPKRYTVY